MEPLSPEFPLPDSIVGLASADGEGLPKVRRLYRALYEAIAAGALPHGCRLPSSRELAARLGFGRNTVVTVYAQLTAEGLLSTDGRRGTRVVHRTRRAAGERAPRWALAARAERFARPPVRHRALAPGEPDPTLFPPDAWRRALGRAAALPAERLGYTAGSLPVLQEALTRHLATYRSLVVAPERIVVTSGTRQSLLLAATLFADAGDTVWVESPGYPGARDAFALQGLDVRPCPVDADGLVPPDEEPPRLVYLTPCFQYPSGVALGATRAQRLLALSSEHGSVLFEDDYDSEFRDDSQPRPALAAASPAARVLHAGTFSKLMFPAVRVAWLVVPEAHVNAAHACLRALGGGNTNVAQAAVAELLDNGVVARHLQRARGLYARRRHALLDALARESPFEAPHRRGIANGGTNDASSGGSLSHVVALRSPVPIAALERALDAHALGAVPLERLDANGTSPPRRCRALVLGLGNVDTLAVPSTVGRLAAAVGEAARTTPTRRASVRTGEGR